MQYQLMNWPPSRGPMPKWMREKPHYEAPMIVKRFDPPEPRPENWTPPIKVVEPKLPPLPPKPKRVGKHVLFTSAQARYNAAKRDAQRKLSIRMNLNVALVGELTLEQAAQLLRGSKEEFWVPRRRLIFDLRYPLDSVARVTIDPFIESVKGPNRRESKRARMNVGYVLWQLARAYKIVYRQWKAYGVWGHAMSDLYFEGIDISDNIGTVFIGS